jgi:hypothetical protein
MKYLRHGSDVKAHGQALRGAYEEADAIFLQVSEETRRPSKHIVASHTNIFCRKSEWNLYQAFFADPKKERARVGNSNATGEYPPTVNDCELRSILS